MNYKYSVIIPYRDKYDLLLIAIASIPDRADIQIIIIDNSDVSLPFDKIPVKNYAHIDYLTSDSAKGAGYARNVGIEAAEGDFILFLDADDYFMPQAFDTFDKYIYSDFDIVYFNATSVRLADGSVSKRHVRIDKIIKQYFVDKSEDLLRYDFPWPYCKLYNASFIKNNNLEFDVIKCSNDVMFSLKSGCAARRICVEGTIVYVITEGEKNSSLTKTKSRENNFIRFQVAVRKNNIYIELGKPYLQTRLLPRIFHAVMNGGLKELPRYIHYARENGVNVFVGYFNRKYDI